jgi:hypothetical protein
MTKTSVDQSDSPETEEINLDDIPEIDFSHAVRGAFYEWATQAKGKFHEVSDEEDARRTPAEREPGPLLKKALARVRRASGR